MLHEAKIIFPRNQKDQQALVGRKVRNQDGKEGVITNIDISGFPIDVSFPTYNQVYQSDGYCCSKDFYITLV
jgi:hypothetical protein